MKNTINKLAIIGLGLMGGSLGMAVREKGIVRTVSGFARRKEVREEAIKRGAVDLVYDNIEEAVKDADMVILCVPVLAVPELAQSCLPYLAPGCVVTDVASTKTTIIASIERLFQNEKIYFVGSHPMAGSEQTGIQFARKDLYKNAVVAVTPTRRSRASAVKTVVNFWKKLEASPILLSPQEHDAIVARTSHLPHLIAACIVTSVFKEKNRKTALLCGPGFRDFTRIASSSEELWHDIISTNSSAILKEMRNFIVVIDRVTRMIENKDFAQVRDFLRRSRLLRNEWISSTGKNEHSKR